MKKILAFASTSGAILLLLWDHIGNVHLCTSNGVVNYDCLSFLSQTEIVLLPILPLAILSVITYFLREEIFKTWFFFAKIWVPLSIFLTLITPETTGSSFIPFYGRPHLALSMSVLFLVISLILIIWKYSATRRSS